MAHGGRRVSQPQDDDERAMLRRLESIAGPADNPVSTACPSCNTRFAMLAKYGQDGWRLRCTVCLSHFDGSLK